MKVMQIRRQWKRRRKTETLMKEREEKKKRDRPEKQVKATLAAPRKYTKHEPRS